MWQLEVRGHLSNPTNLAAMEGEDPVVSTLDVQFHPWRDGALHVLSYPLRPAYRPPELPSAVRMRPTRRAIETVYARDLGPATGRPGRITPSRLLACRWPRS